MSGGRIRTRKLLVPSVNDVDEPLFFNFVIDKIRISKLQIPVDKKIMDKIYNRNNKKVIKK